MSLQTLEYDSGLLAAHPPGPSLLPTGLSFLFFTPTGGLFQQVTLRAALQAVGHALLLHDTRPPPDVCDTLSRDPPVP